MKKENIKQKDQGVEIYFQSNVSKEELEQENINTISIMTQEIKEEYRRNGSIRTI